MTRFNQIKSEIKALSATNILALHNDFADENHWDHIYILSDSLDKFKSAEHLYKCIMNGSVSISDTYLTYSGSGHLISFDNIEDEKSTFDIDEIAKWLDEKGNEGDYNISVI